MDHLSELRIFLARTPFFGGVDDQALTLLVGALVRHDVEAGGVVFREGDTGRSMFIVESGEVVALQGAGDAHPVKLMRFRQGDFFGETTLIEMQPRPFTAVVEHRARVHELTSRHLYDLYLRDIQTYVMVLQNINRELCRRLRRASSRVSHFASELHDEETQIPDEFSGRLPDGKT
jgi:CRP/FNR family cyclic AMP-dependent transcriptional regulator